MQVNGVIKKVAAIHDMSGFGRSSLTAIIPTLSTMGVQVCPLPTAILSNHTGGFEKYSYVDLTDTMQDYIDMWKELGLEFDCIYSGFLGSTKQIQIVSDFIDYFGSEKNLVVVDPVMGDNGALYSAYTDAIIPAMKKLVTKADMITPTSPRPPSCWAMTRPPRPSTTRPPRTGCTAWASWAPRSW